MMKVCSAMLLSFGMSAVTVSVCVRERRIYGSTSVRDKGTYIWLLATDETLISQTNILRILALGNHFSELFFLILTAT